jgi:hypothetical protein
MVNVPAALHHPSSLETARFPGGPFHLSLSNANGCRDRRQQLSSGDTQTCLPQKRIEPATRAGGS